MPGPPLPCSSLRRPPSDACRLHSAARPACFGPAEVSPLLRVVCAHLACCALPACALPVRFPWCLAIDPRPHPTATMATDRPAPTLCARRLRDADESDPHFRPRRLCSHLRRARSDQDDQPAAGHAGARWPLHPFLSVLYFRPALHEELRPGQGKCSPSAPVSRCSARNPCPETRVTKPCIPYPGI